MKRQWLIAAALVALTGMGISCGDDGGGDPAEDDGATRRRVAEALTSGLDFEGGIEQLEPMPDTTDEDLVIEQDSAPIGLEPGVASLLPFDIENPDEEDPVVATLLQFEDGEEDEHVEVPLDLADGATMAEVAFDVADSVCDTLCADSFAVKLIQALKTRGGRIGARVTRNLLLTCAEDGEDATMCESADPGGDGDGDGVLDLGDSLASGALRVNTALCTCAGVNCATLRWLTSAELTCVRDALEADASNASPNFRALVSSLANASTVSAIENGTCDPAGVFEIAVPTAAAQELPTAILDCDEDMNTFFPAAGADAGVAP